MGQFPNMFYKKLDLTVPNISFKTGTGYTYQDGTATNGSTISGDDARDNVLNAANCDPNLKYTCTYDGTNISGDPARDIRPDRNCDATGAGACEGSAIA